MWYYSFIYSIYLVGVRRYLLTYHRCRIVVILSLLLLSQDQWRIQDFFFFLGRGSKILIILLLQVQYI